jgi:hypothetical protein
MNRCLTFCITELLALLPACPTLMELAPLPGKYAGDFFSFVLSPERLPHHRIDRCHQVTATARACRNDVQFGC